MNLGSIQEDDKEDDDKDNSESVVDQIIENRRQGNQSHNLIQLQGQHHSHHKGDENYEEKMLKQISKKNKKNKQLITIDELPSTPTHIQIQKKQQEQYQKSKFKQQQQLQQQKQSLKRGSQINKIRKQSIQNTSYSQFQVMDQHKKQSIIRNSIKQKDLSSNHRIAILNFQSRMSVENQQFSKFANAQEVIQCDDIYDYLQQIIDFEDFKIDLELQMIEIRAFNSQNMVHEFFQLNNIKKKIRDKKGLHSITYADMLAVKSRIGMNIIEYKIFQEMQENYVRENLKEIQQLQEIEDFDLQIDPEQQQQTRTRQLKMQMNLKKINDQKITFDVDKFLKEIEQSVSFSKHLYTQFYKAQNKQLDINLDFSHNLQVAVINLIDSAIQFQTRSVYKGRAAFLQTFEIYKKIFKGQQIHPSIAEYYYRISPFFKQQEEIQKELILQLIQLKQHHFKKADKLKIRDKKIVKQQLKEINMAEFYEDLIFEILKYNKPLHEIFDDHRKKVEAFIEINGNLKGNDIGSIELINNLALSLKKFYLEFCIKRKQNLLHTYEYLSLNENHYLDEVKSDKQDLILNNQDIKQNYFTEEEIQKIQNHKKQNLSFMQIQKKIQEKQKQEQIEQVKAKKQQILALSKVQSVQKYIREYENLTTLDQQQLQNLYKAGQVELSVDKGQDFTDQTIKSSQTDQSKVLRKGLLICKALWDDNKSHRNNFLYQLMEYNYLKSQNIDMSSEALTELELKDSYVRPEASPSPKSGKQDYFNFEDPNNINK